jgi:hypothetical protein
VEVGELVDDVTCPRLDVGIVGGGKSTSARHQILEHHDEVVLLGCREPHRGDAHGNLTSQVPVEPGLGDAHPGLVDQRALLFVERWELDEHAVRDAGFPAQRDARPTRRPGAAVDDGDVRHVAPEHLREPARVEVADVDGQFRLQAHNVTVTSSPSPRRAHDGLEKTQPTPPGANDLYTGVWSAPLAVSRHVKGLSGGDL